MAIATKCQTPGAIFDTEIHPHAVSVVVDLPIGGWLYLTAEQAELLEANLHNAIELALAPFFIPFPDTFPEE